MDVTEALRQSIQEHLQQQLGSDYCVTQLVGDAGRIYVMDRAAEWDKKGRRSLACYINVEHENIIVISGDDIYSRVNLDVENDTEFRICDPDLLDKLLIAARHMIENQTPKKNPESPPPIRRHYTKKSSLI